MRSFGAGGPGGALVWSLAALGLAACLSPRQPPVSPVDATTGAQVVAPAPPDATPRPSVDEVVARWWSATCGAGARPEQLQPVALQGRAEAGDGVSTWSEARAPGAYQFEAQYPELRVRQQLVDGIAWAEDPTTHLAWGSQLLGLQMAAARAPLLDRARWYSDAQVAGFGTLDGAAVISLRLQPKLGRAFTAHYTRDSGLLAAVESDEGVVRYSDFRQTCGCMEPWLRDVRDGAHPERQVVEQATCGLPIAPWPSPVSPLTGEAPLIVVDGLPAVLAQMEGRPLVLLVDTGATSTVIAPADAGAAAGARLQANDAGGSYEVAVAALPAIDLGALRLPPQQAVLSPMPHPALSGIVGAATLQNQLVELRFGDSPSLRFSPSEAPVGTGVEGQVLLGGLMVAPVRFDGVEALCIVDTGADRTVVNWRVANQQGHIPGGRSSPRAGGMVGASGLEIPVYALPAQSVVFGDQTSTLEPLAANLTVFDRVAPDGPACVLGMDALMGRTLRLDYAQARVWIW